MRAAIEARLQDLFIAESGLDPITVFFRGEPLFIQHYPIAVIFVQRQRQVSQETGLWVYEYDGYIAIEEQMTDTYRIADRRATVDSYVNVAAYLDTASDVIEANQGMSMLTVDGETGRIIKVIGEKSYGLQERPNSINNRGEVSFTVQTQKLRT